MNIIISMKARSRVYHKRGCMYETRIRYGNRMEMDIREAEENGYCPCRFCAGLRGSVRCMHRLPDPRGRASTLTEWEAWADQGVELTYDRRSDTLYARTTKGFWKIFYREGIGMLLYHRNRYALADATEALKRGDYHRQSDVRPEPAVRKLITYIRRHDTAKEIIDVDYRQLPRNTRKQRKYYRCAEQRAKRAEKRRVRDLFSMLERGEKVWVPIA